MIDMSSSALSEVSTASQTGAVTARTTTAPAGSISFVFTILHDAADVLPLLNVLEKVRRPDDEVIVLIREGRPQTYTQPPEWVRIVAVPDVSIFRQRTYIPVLCSKEWVVLLEDHIMVEPAAFEAIRALIREQPDLDIIPFIAKNLTSVGTWDWAIFMFTFALVWGPLDHSPPFSAVTSSIVRRASLGPELRDGEWELRVIPRIFQTGKRAYSNAIFMDHIKPKTFWGAVTNIFLNARSGAELQLALGNPKRDILWEGWYTFWHRPGELMRALAARRHELPAGTQLRLHVLGFTHLTGFIVCLLFGGGRAAYLLD